MKGHAKDEQKKKELMRKIQTEKRKIQRIYVNRVKYSIIKEIHKNYSKFGFLTTDNLKLSFFDIPNCFLEDYKELMEQIK